MTAHSLSFGFPVTNSDIDQRIKILALACEAVTAGGSRRNAREIIEYYRQFTEAINSSCHPAIEEPTPRPSLIRTKTARKRR